MAARQIIVGGAMPSRDGNGRALPAVLYFFEPDTAYSTPATVYTTSALDVAHEFPIESDAAGRFAQIWADEADSFDVTWNNKATGAQIRTYGDISPLSDAMEASAEIAETAADAAMEAQEAAEEAQRQTEALLAEASGEPFNATSSTSLSIGTGSKAFVLNETGKLYQEGQTVVAAVDGSALNQMILAITSFDEDTSTLTGTVIDHFEPGGVGPYAAWVISLSGRPGGVSTVAGRNGTVTLTTADLTDLATYTAARRAEAIAFALVL